MAENNFLGRWSRKKAGLVDEPVHTESKDKQVDDHKIPEEAQSHTLVSEAPEIENKAPPPPPTMEDVEKIDSMAQDFSAFMRSDVDPLVQQAAMKKMFSDPHFNVMDGLDIYIDDYTKSDPIPLEMLKRMNQSELLGLFKSAEELYPDSKAVYLDEVKETEETSKQESGPVDPPQTETSEVEQTDLPPSEHESIAPQMDIESEALDPKVLEKIPIGEKLAKPDSDHQDS
jgi:hypothetical protein